jgi:hypothetical protein
MGICDREGRPTVSSSYLHRRSRVGLRIHQHGSTHGRLGGGGSGRLRRARRTGTRGLRSGCTGGTVDRRGLRRGLASSAGRGVGRDGGGSGFHLDGGGLRLRCLRSLRGAHSFTREALADDDKGVSDLNIRAPNSDVALVGQAILQGEGRDPSARNVGDLFEAAALTSDHMTDDGVRKDDGQLEAVRLALRSQGLSKGQGQGSGGDGSCWTRGGTSLLSFCLRVRLRRRSRGGDCLTLVGQSCLLDLSAELLAGEGSGGVETVTELDKHLSEPCHLSSEGGDRVGHKAVRI